MIRAEGRLITNYLVDSDGRCAGGVLVGAREDVLYDGRGFWPKRPVAASCEFWDEMVSENNSFRGTPEELAEHMAQWFEAKPRQS